MDVTGFFLSFFVQCISRAWAWGCELVNCSGSMRPSDIRCSPNTARDCKHKKAWIWYIDLGKVVRSQCTVIIPYPTPPPPLCHWILEEKFTQYSSRSISNNQSSLAPHSTVQDSTVRSDPANYLCPHKNEQIPNPWENISMFMVLRMPRLGGWGMKFNALLSRTRNYKIQTILITWQGAC